MKLTRGDQAGSPDPPTSLYPVALHCAVVCRFASKNIKVLVIANPANTNCLILKEKASSIPPQNFHALTYLDHNRARSQLALKLGVSVGEIRNVCIWGNHVSTHHTHP